MSASAEAFRHRKEGGKTARLKFSPGLSGHVYFPAIVRVESDSPIDALLALCVPRNEAMDLVAASWIGGGTSCCLVTTIDGGRPVVVLRTPDERWAGCNALLGELCVTPQEAARRLGKLLGRHRRGYVACMPTGHVRIR